MTAFTLTLLLVAISIAAILAVDWTARRARRRDREIVRRVTRYLDSLPPARPW